MRKIIIRKSSQTMNKSFVREIPLMICGACGAQVDIPRIRLTPIRRLGCGSLA